MKGLLFLIWVLVTVRCYAENPSVFLVEDIHHKYNATGFELKTPKGQVTITNRHVCQNQAALFAFPVGKTARLILVQEISLKSDLCVLTPVYGVSALELASGYDIQPVTVEGYPDGKYQFSKGSLIGYTLGKIKGLNVDNILVTYKGSVTLGSSGSPVMDSQNRVVGVISLVNPLGTYGDMVPLEYIKQFLNIN